MTQSCFHDGRAVASASARFPRASKAPRDRLTRLEVEAEICPQVLLRTLGLIAQHSLVPLTIDFEQRDAGLWFEIEVEGLRDNQAATLLSRVETLVMVRSARLSRRQPS